MLYKAVSRSAHRRDMFGGGRVVFKFFSQPVYVNGNGGVVAHGFHAPYLYIQFLTAEQHSFIHHEESEQLVFLVFQFYLISPLINSVLRRIQGDIPHRKYRRVSLDIAFAHSPELRNMRLYSCHEHRGGKRFFYIIVRAQTQPAYLIQIGSLCRNH